MRAPHRKALTLWFVTLLFVLFSAEVKAEYSDRKGQAPKNLVIMGWDGADYDVLLELLAAGKLPNLSRFLSTCGGHLVPVDLIARTETVASWAQVFTGLTYDQSGVLGNREMMRSIMGNVPGLTEFDTKHAIFTLLGFWIQPIPYEQSIFKAFQDQGYKTAWIISKMALVGNDCNRTPLCEVALKADLYYARSPYGLTEGPPEFLEAVKTDDTYLNYLTQKTVEFVKGNSKYILFCHVDQDFYGHHYGKDSERYRQEFIRGDASFGAVLDTINPKNTRMILLTDHGFDGIEGHTHKNASQAWMITNLPIHSLYRQQPRQRAFATLRDIAPTILSWAGINYRNWMPQLRGHNLLQ